MQTIKKHPLLLGTLILTITGLFSRLIGFYYRIYLTKLFGEEGMGIYQLLSPILSLSFSLTSAAYQTAISKFVAEKTANAETNSLHPLFAGLSMSLPLSLLCNFIIFRFADFIGNHFLLEPRTISMLKILSFSIPFAASHSCINGYFYGKKKASVPAFTQLLEQLTRVFCVYSISTYAFSKGIYPTLNIAVLGLTIGEIISMITSLLCLYFHCSKEKKSTYSFRPKQSITTYGCLLTMILPLTANRIILTLLQSVESVSIPAKLRIFGYDSSTALSIYGVLTGMAMPLIFFPNALTGSLAVLLLPVISEGYAKGDLCTVRKTIHRSIVYSSLLGFLFLCFFVILGNFLGDFLFHSSLAGHFITTLGFICPFLYLDTTLSSILQGLGKASSIFLLNVICLTLRLLFIFYFVPIYGIKSYLYGLLLSQLLLCILYLYCLSHYIPFKKE